MKKSLIILLVIMLFASTTVTAAFNDIDEANHTLNKAVSVLSEHGIANGVSETSFEPDSDLTRGQMATFITRILNNGTIPEDTFENNFSDISDPTYNNAISWANNKGILKGVTDTKFEPDGKILLQDAYAMLCRALGYEDSASLEYPTGYISTAEKIGLNKNLDKNVTYETPLTRGNAAILLYNALYADTVEGNALASSIYGKKKFKVVSCNIRGNYLGDAQNAFVLRAGYLANKIYTEKPDVIVFQEMTADVLAMLKKLIPDYEFIGHGRNADFQGEGLYTAIKTDTCTFLGWDSIWLSPTPNTPATIFEDQSIYPRICVQALVKHNESGKVMRVFNIHLDHLKDAVRAKQIKTTFEYIDSFSEKGDYPYILLGDFNAKADQETISICNERTDIQDVSNNIKDTFHAFGTSDPKTKIDYIFVTNDLAEYVYETDAWTDERNGTFLSDHYPIYSELWFD